ncbi:PilZ domain-containing protein [Chryseomicrobium palamuruense]|uniref:PilZ domain-containing protein n=1 Tax=Chryseomicrobium palamuruense TaxID=682973 RepID=A0ABV8UWB0_9BACL
MTTEDRRELFRVDFKENVFGKMSIAGYDVEIVKFINISSMGALIETDTDIRAKTKMELRFSINGVPFLVEGTIVRKVVFPDYNHYGIVFKEDRTQFQQLFRELNSYKIRKAKPHLVDED